MQRFYCTSARISNFVPKCLPVRESDVIALDDFVNKAKTLVVLSGAGLSTDSGIPDYRSDGVGLYARSNRRPVDFITFVKNEKAHRRYWARNFVAWPQFSAFQPNSGHFALAKWEKLGKLNYIITQNVDRLHSKAGSKRLIELHGTTHKVICLECRHSQSRLSLQDEIKEENIDWLRNVSIENAIAPDGDIMLNDEVVDGFKVPKCKYCNGMLKPDVVFFGENVPKEIARKVDEIINGCDSLLVIGSSLFVYSGYRIALKCKEEGKSLGILNIGPTRADSLADLKIEARCSEILPRMKFSSDL